MKSAHTPFENVSALSQRRNYTSPAPRPDIAQAVKDIRLACDTIARLAALDTLSEKGVKQ